MPFWYPILLLSPFINFCPHVFKIPYHLFAHILLLQHMTYPPVREFQSIAFLLNESEQIYWILDLYNEVHSIWVIWTSGLQESTDQVTCYLVRVMINYVHHSYNKVSDTISHTMLNTINGVVTNDRDQCCLKSLISWEISGNPTLFYTR